jgi:hypothetical protein
MTFKEFNLTKNPFELIGRSLASEVPVFWAGMKTQKEQIENTYLNANKPRNLILNWGPFGAGKTHAAFYFKNQSILKQNVEFITLYVRTPLEGNNAIEQLLRDIIDDISFTKLKEIIKARVAELGESQLFKLINSTIKSEVYASAIIKLGDCEPKLTEFMYRYVYGNVTRTELKQFQLPRALNTEVDYLKFLAGLIVCLTAGNILTRVVLWIDELENLLYYTSKQFKRLTQGIITLVDTNDNFLVFMNYTLNESDIDTLRILIGDTLWSRINQKIVFTELSMDKGLEYCHDLITHYQIEPSTDYFPFEKDSLKVILNSLHTNFLITPYEINKKCSDILYYSLENQVNKITKERVVSFFNAPRIGGA